MVLSCWCHRQIKAPLPPGCHLHRTQYPLYSQYHHSLFCFICLPGGATPSVMHFFFPHHTAASDTVYIIPSHSLFYSLLKKRRKKKYLTYTLLTPHTHTLSTNHLVLSPTCAVFLSLCMYFLAFYPIFSFSNNRPLFAVLFKAQILLPSLIDFM